MFEIINDVEAVFWFIIGLVFLARGMMATVTYRRYCLIVGVAFMLFGVSDVVEAHTGAWWRPWWLLGWKASCLFVLVFILVGYVRSRRDSTDNHE